jgi:hypothetical protein
MTQKLFTPKETDIDPNKFLSLRQLAKITGMSSHRLGRIAKQPGFPLWEGKVTLPDFQVWYRRKIGLIDSSPLSTVIPPELTYRQKLLARVRRIEPIAK